MAKIDDTDLVCDAEASPPSLFGHYPEDSGIASELDQLSLSQSGIKHPVLSETALRSDDSADTEPTSEGVEYAVTDEDLKKYKHQYPEDFKYDYRDIIIFASEEDKTEVEMLCQRIRKIELDKKEKPRVDLFSEIMIGGWTHVGQLNELFRQELCSYLFVYFTESFKADKLNQFSHEIALAHNIYNGNECIPVVMTSDSKLLSSEPIIQCLSKYMKIDISKQGTSWLDDVKRLIESKLHHRLEKDKEQRHNRAKWIIDKKQREMQTYRQRNEEMKLVYSKEKKRNEQDDNQGQKEAGASELTRNRSQEEAETRHKMIGNNSDEDDSYLFK